MKRSFGFKKGKKDIEPKEESYDDVPEDYDDGYDDLPPATNQRVIMNGKFNGKIIIDNGHVEFDGNFDGEIETAVENYNDEPPFDDDNFDG